LPQPNQFEAMKESVPQWPPGRLSDGSYKIPISLSLFRDLTTHYDVYVLKRIQMKIHVVWVSFII